jgi:hypothetical protein
MLHVAARIAKANAPDFSFSISDLRRDFPVYSTTAVFCVATSLETRAKYY